MARAPKISSEQSRKLRALKAKHRDARPKPARFTRVASVTKQVEKTATKQTFHAAAELVRPSAVKDSLRQLYAFFFMEMSLLVLWVFYRSTTHFPVWFDEGVAKAIVFGLPVFWFAARSRFIAKEIGLDGFKLIPGIFLGLAFGGLYGFSAILMEVLRGREIVQGAFFATEQFWWLAFLALLTAWWESLFFFGLPVQFVKSVASWFSDSLVGVFVILVFLAFHAPIRFLVTGATPQFVVQMGVLALFVIGQYVVYLRTKNLYALVLSHLFWGLVIQVYSQSY